jgi:hypothetical protein
MGRKGAHRAPSDLSGICDNLRGARAKNGPPGMERRMDWRRTTEDARPEVESPPGGLGPFLEWLGERKSEIRSVVTEHGSLLFRGAPLWEPAHLEAALRALGVEPQPYVEGQSPRTRLFGNIYTSTEYPAGAVVDLHHELSYRATPPPLLAFLSVEAAEGGGETPLLDGDRFTIEADPSVVRPFFERDLLYRKVMPGEQGLGRTWQAHFEREGDGAEDREAVGAFLRAEGASFGWLDSGGLWVEQRRPAFREHAHCVCPVWYNQVTLWHPSYIGPRGQRLRALLGADHLPTDVRWGDGSPLPDGLVAAVRAEEHRLATRRAWRAGDFLLLDNHRVAHGRAPFRGKRRLLVGLGEWS